MLRSTTFWSSATSPTCSSCMVASLLARAAAIACLFGFQGQEGTIWDYWVDISLESPQKTSGTGELFYCCWKGWSGNPCYYMYRNRTACLGLRGRFLCPGGGGILRLCLCLSPGQGRSPHGEFHGGGAREEIEKREEEQVRQRVSKAGWKWGQAQQTISNGGSLQKTQRRCRDSSGPCPVGRWVGRSFDRVTWRNYKKWSPTAPMPPFIKCR